jgi:anti-sigma factor RsiW
MSHNGCRGETELLLEYAAGGLDAAGREAVERHIEECGPCRDFVAGQRAAWAALDGWEAPPVSGDFDRRLYARIAREASWRDWIPRPFSPALMRRGLPVAAAAGLALVAVLVMNRPESDRPAPPAAAQQVEPLRPDQAETALQDMEMLREFSGLVRPDPADSKM